MGQKGLMFLEADGSKCLNQIFSSIGLGEGGGKFNFLTLLIRNSGTPYVLKYALCLYKYALQEDSLLKCFKSYFEEKTFYCTLFLVGL